MSYTKVIKSKGFTSTLQMSSNIIKTKGIKDLYKSALFNIELQSPLCLANGNEYFTF